MSSTRISNETGPMNAADNDEPSRAHSHVFLGAGHASNERKTWAVIVLCTIMMVLEIVGGALFGSLALVADGLHMSTHAIAMLIAALAYTFARRYASDQRFSFGTGKLGDLAGFTSATILALIALFIGYEAVSRFFDPVHIRFGEAIPIAVLGLLVNIVSAWLLSGGDDHHHQHGHGHDHDEGSDADGHDDTPHRLASRFGTLTLQIVEVGTPPRFRVEFSNNDQSGLSKQRPGVLIETVRSGGVRQSFALRDAGGYLESIDEIPEPHEFTAVVAVGSGAAVEKIEVAFVEHEHHAGASAHRDHNLRAAFVHVLGDAAVSVLAILALLSGRYLGWVWMDPVMGIVGAGVIAAWAYALVRDTGRILLDMTPDPAMARKIKQMVERHGDRVTDLHLWRLGPGHLGAIVAVVTGEARGPDFYREKLASLRTLSHLTIEVVAKP